MNTEATQIETIAEGVYTIHSDELTALNASLMNGFLNHQHDADIKRTHLFNGRYENIYLDENDIPELKKVMSSAQQYANAILGTSEIDCDYWFNFMPVGAVTTLHRHDDDDELLSAAYYVSVPLNSGDLIIHAKSGPVHIQPVAGSFVFFYPDIAHEVTENYSDENRLSIGINFGVKHSNHDI